MRRAAWIAVLALAAACAAPRRDEPPFQKLSPAPIATVEVKDPNFEAIVVEAVPNADDEGVSFTKIR